MGARILCVGAFPPPVHGMSTVNLAVLERLRSNGAKVAVFDISASTLSRDLISRVRKFPRLVWVFLRFLVMCSLSMGASVYIGMSGGYGQIYNFFFVLIARLFGCRLYLHHHSFAYLSSKKILSGLIFWLAGSNCQHVVLCACMGRSLRKCYGDGKRVLVVSNSAFVPSRVRTGMVVRPVVVFGFLGNICAEKGIFLFLDVLSRMFLSGRKFGAIVAGPFQDETTEALVRARLSELRFVQYVGPKYGVEKDAFYKSIDALIFPTRYANEAEPLIILEAMSHGVPVMSFDRGCISEMIPSGGGRLIVDSANAETDMYDVLAFWHDEPEKLVEASAVVFSNYYSMSVSGGRAFAELCEGLLGGDALQP